MYFRLVDIYLKDREGSTWESYDSFYETVLEFLVPDWPGSEADSLMIQARDMVESNVERGQHL